MSSLAEPVKFHRMLSPDRPEESAGGGIGQGELGGRPMLFDLLIGGHHVTYIRHLVDCWDVSRWPNGLDFVVSPLFLERHGDLVRRAREESLNIRFIAISASESTALNGSRSELSRLLRMVREWQLMCRYASRLGASHCLLMYLDSCWLPIAMGMSAPCPLSGIYFRPALHYSTFANYRPAKNENWQRWRESFILHRMLRHPQLHKLLTLDPFAVKPISQRIEQQRSAVKIDYLVDPIQRYSIAGDAAINLREKLAIASHKKIFLLFGALTSRKGIDQLLAALRLLSAEQAGQIALVLLGPGNRPTLSAKVKALKQVQPVQVIENYDFVADQVVQIYFEMADVVLALYQRHVGMSGILLWAAAAQKPVLSTDYGLMGELVNRHSLGLTVDSSCPSAIAEGLVKYLQDSGSEIGDRTQMKSFADSHSPNRFAETIIETICAQPAGKKMARDHEFQERIKS